MSKIAYSQFAGPEWSALKSVLKSLGSPALLNKWYDQICWTRQRLAAKPDAVSVAGGECLPIYAMWLEKFGRCPHYFVAPGVADFCISACKQLTVEYWRPFPAVPAISLDFMAVPAAVKGGMWIHFPANEHRKSILCVPEYCIPCTTNGGYSCRIAVLDSDGNYLLLGWHDLASADTPMARLVCGLSLYMDAFPDAIVPAADHSVHHLRHYKGEQRQIGRAPAMEHEERCAVRPHFRRGHFRVLRSSKFVHKRGQTIFIAGTFVRGTAFDILDDAPPAKDAK